MTSLPMTVGELLPTFAAELRGLLERVGRQDLAGQVVTLPVVARCTCGEDSCAHFYTTPPPQSSYPLGHSTLSLPAASGTIILDIVCGQIAAVEVLDRSDVKSVIDHYLPLKA